MNQIITELKKIPPVTRFVCGSSLGVTLGLLVNVLPIYKVLYVGKFVFSRRLELWRLYTPFFIGGGGIGYIFQLIMIYRTVNDIESRSYPGRSSDLAWQLFWACASIIVATRPLGSMIFSHSFILCIVYLYSVLASPGTMTSILGLVTVPVAYYPYILIAFDLIQYGPSAAAQGITGALVGHLWWWSVWGAQLGSQGVLANYARAPQWLRNLMGETGNRRPPTVGVEATGEQGRGGAAASLAQGGVHVTAPRTQALRANSTGHNWGSGGQRLGT